MEMTGTGGFGPTQVWDTVQSWCTPTVLFLLLNVVIGTIAVTSRVLGKSTNNENPNGLRRAPSLLTRFSSMSFIKRANDQTEMQTWIEPEEAVAEDNVVVREVEKEEVKIVQVKKRQSRAAQGRGGASSGLSQRTGNVKNVIGRSKSDAATLLDLHPPPPPLPGTIKKAETFELTHSHTRDVVAEELTISPLSEHFHEESAAGGSTAEGVDAKADDFINKFKQQLKLQRLESLMRYKETINRKI